MSEKNDADNFGALVEQGRRALALLPRIEEVFARLDEPRWIEEFKARQRLLKEGTLSGETVRRLCELARSMGVNDLPARAFTHPPSFSAHAKQHILPEATLVQKTISIKIASQYVLCTGVGDWSVSRALKKSIMQALDLPAKSIRDFALNPPSFDPIAELGMWPGMVSPFVAKSPLSVRAIVMLAPGEEANAQQLAISLSLYESLLLPAKHITKLIQLFLGDQQPALPLIELAP